MKIFFRFIKYSEGHFLYESTLFSIDEGKVKLNVFLKAMALSPRKIVCKSVILLQFF